MSLEGDIDLSTVPAVRTALGRCDDHGVTDIDVDLAAVGFCDASGLHVFLAASKRLAAAGEACGCTVLPRPYDGSWSSPVRGSSWPTGACASSRRRPIPPSRPAGPHDQ
ncbi:STAS domain-containing protein [Streptomyces sp. BBFR51]|uniref:STAS domain-containing protein n=1 Tax=Streptomyces sp. BBFR51 TaxID=3372856 RepID=UPI0037DC1648